MKRFIEKFYVLGPEPGADWSRGKKALYWLWRAGLLLCAGICLSLLMLAFAYGQYPPEVFRGYFRSGKILVLNTLPVLALLGLLYGLIGRAWAAFLLTGAVSFGLSLANYFKIHFRDDPLYLQDLLIIREARAMTTEQHYTLFVTPRMLAAACCILAGTAVLLFLARGKLGGWKRRGAVTAAAVLLAGGMLPVLLNEDVFNSVDNYEHLNKWAPTQNYLAHGFFYPFVHGLVDTVDLPPAGYSKAGARDLLAEYADADIPADQKVSVIALMRESYVDFSQYGIRGLDVSGYDLYHALEEESYTGTLVTNIFSGGTIDTERTFLTGSYKLREPRGELNSYLWYLRDQGYTVEGSHPYYKWFYNRQYVNSYLGFENYRFLEGDYRLLTDTSLPEDSVLFREIYSDFLKNKETGRPYFSFDLNIQSHGPYATDKYDGDVQYLTGDYSQACKNAMNNYMASIMDSDVELMKLVDRLRAEEEPVVLVTFGDHLPWMGAGSIYYDEMGVDMDMDTEAGFRRHYSTEYLIWANDAARAVLGNDFVGEGPTISPCYLMNLVFDQCGWEGPAYMQAMDDMMEVFPVVTIHDCYVVDGAFTDFIPQERKALFDQFQYLQHYWRTAFLFD